MKRTINFMGARHAVLAVTLLLILASLASLLFKGLNYGLDFTGGSMVELSYSKPVDLNTVRMQLQEAGFEGAVVQSFGATTDVVVRMPSEDAQIGVQIAKALQANGGDAAFSIHRVDFVGPAVGEELRDQGGLGMLLALGGILIYVAFRFQWKFGFGAVLSLFHDVILVLGVFSFFELTFDLTVLAAVLAVIGYSLNDTIVVFDRIRENFRLLRKADLVENINVSTTQTLLRTLATSISTLLAVGALMLFGGENLWGFSLALFIGILVGTTSSIYVANATLIWLNLDREDLIPPALEEASRRS
ncbi:protein translocase subunit SecF [Azomonas macrocytogenes]|uniref:Protein-export membrane protein SecF n=1 Tax=Azomonas macrocytogenes TaxID=69962 RepID=A0A839T061_AZOMA|nr:protein translocase subunit SecF [Azomonas macrocytogenes]MBB3101910.1 preprotein translocase subunit SecF [Azomonas macrocytogenes]